MRFILEEYLRLVLQAYYLAVGTAENYHIPLVHNNIFTGLITYMGRLYHIGGYIHLLHR